MRCLATLLILQGCYLSHGLEDVPEGTVTLETLYGTAGAPAEELSDVSPVLYEVNPHEGCTNTDQLLTLVGSGIHWRGTITITYPHSGASADVTSIDWYDLSETSFRTPADLAWVPAQVGPSLPSGDYLVYVTNPNGEVSNQIGINLQWCQLGAVR